MSFDLNTITIDSIFPIIQEVSNTYLTRENSQNITVKGDSNFVTEVDTQIEKAMKERLLSLYPDTQFMGEEEDNNDVDFTTPVWILDPVDGTSNLIHDFQNSSMSLALTMDKKVVFGVIYHYSSKEYFYAKKGEGAYVGCASFINPNKPECATASSIATPIQVSNITELSRSLVVFGTSPYDKATLGDKNFETIKQIFFACEDIRCIGSAAIELAYVAAGRVEIYFERNLKPWDFAAGIVILEEAGGIVTDYEGQPIDISKPCDILAGNKVVHQKLRETITL